MLTNLENLEHFPEGGRVENRKQLDFAKKKGINEQHVKLEVDWVGFVQILRNNPRSWFQGISSNPLRRLSPKDQVGKNMDKHGGGLRDVRD